MIDFVESKGIELSLPLRKDELLKRLLEFGHDWRESKLPASFRDRGVYGSTIIATHDGFRMTLEHGRREPHFVLRATIVPSENATIIRGRLELTTWYRAWVAVFSLVIVALFFGIMLTDVNVRASDWLVAGIVSAIGETFLFISIYPARRRAATEFRTLLEHAASRPLHDAV